jgi:hypothetical protein
MVRSPRGHRLRHLAVIVASACIASPLAAQTTVQSTFGPGGSFALGTSYVIGADAPGVNYSRELATSFTYGGPAGFELFDIGLALRNASAGAPNVSYNIRFTSGSDFETSTELQSWSFGTSIITAAPQLQRFDFGSGFALLTGETYWLHVSAIGDDAGGGWAQSDPVAFGASGELIRRDTENNPLWTNWSSPLPAYDVRATGAPTSVPEPAMAALLLLGLVPITLRTRRTRAV